MNYYLSPYERDNEDLPQMINLNSIFHVCIFLKKIIYSTYVGFHVKMQIILRMCCSNYVRIRLWILKYQLLFPVFMCVICKDSSYQQQY